MNIVCNELHKSRPVEHMNLVKNDAVESQAIDKGQGALRLSSRTKWGDVRLEAARRVAACCPPAFCDYRIHPGAAAPLGRTLRL